LQRARQTRDDLGVAADHHVGAHVTDTLPFSVVFHIGTTQLIDLIVDGAWLEVFAHAVFRREPNTSPHSINHSSGVCRPIIHVRKQLPLILLSLMKAEDAFARGLDRRWHIYADTPWRPGSFCVADDPLSPSQIATRSRRNPADPPDTPLDEQAH
jgi:hypothetical protein